MVEEEQIAEIMQSHASAGDKLRAARELKGWSLEQVSAETRISERHLEQIEAGEFADLPGRTYAFGFSRSYAREVGLDADAIVQQVREELSLFEPEGGPSRTFEPGDPGRVPSARLAWISALIGLLIFAVGGWFLWSSFIAPAGSLDWQSAEESAQVEAAAPAAAEPASPVASGPVVFTSKEEGIWVKFYDGDGARLMEKQMNKGESYTVPQDAKNPMVWTGRPDALTITIGGQDVPPLSDSEGLMKDVPVTADALLKRGEVPNSPDSAASPTV